MPYQPEADSVLVPVVLGRAHSRAAELAELAVENQLTIAVAESLTSGQIAAALGAASGSAQWFRGAVVAYSREVKHRVLGVPDGPVVSESAATAMVEGVRTLFEATIALGVTGAGGPEGQDEEPPGSVWFAVATGGGVYTRHRQFGGQPAKVLDQVVDFAVQLLLTTTESATVAGGDDNPPANDTSQ